eukprot:9410178-Pyramimonas_sp.AAC.1
MHSCHLLGVRCITHTASRLPTVHRGLLARVVMAAIIPARGSLWPGSHGHGPVSPAWALTLGGWGRRPKARPMRSTRRTSDDW